MRGKTISIFIPDGNARSIKICDIQDSIVKALFIPRNKLDDIAKRKEVQDPGIYFLIGLEDELDKLKIYIGEAENILTRLKQHNASKDFWNTAICFVSEKKNINKAHIKYLENYCCQQAKIVNRCNLENSTTPTQSTLTESDVDFVLSFYDDLKVLMSTLGYPIFEEIKKEEKDLFICKGKDAYAEGEYTVDGLVVLKGSKCNLVNSNTIGKWVVSMRNMLVDKGVLKQEGNVYVFLENHVFNAPSTASDVVLARSSNGWTEWKDKKGRTLDERIRKQ